MKSIRVIPRIDIKGPNLVKGIHLEGLRVLGKPEDFAQHYYKNGADELIFMDVVASLYGRNSLHDIISRTAKKIFIPLTVGGGIRTLDDIKNVLRAGADKVSLNTSAINNPQIIKEASLKFGSSTIVVSIEAIKSSNGKYLVYTDNGREFTGIDALEWAKKAEELGAGEIVLTSVDREGTGNGYDLEFIKMMASSISIPLIAHGGPGKLSDISDAIFNNADAVAVSSMLHYDFVKKYVSSGHTESEGNIEFLKSGKSFGKIQTATISEIKLHLAKNSIKTRVINL